MSQVSNDRKFTPFKTIEAATNYLLRAAATSGVRHLSYWYLHYVDGVPDHVIWVATYDPAYMSFYMTRFTPLDDPVITSVMENKFVDWAEWFDVDRVAQTVDPMMVRYGITKYGISLPLSAPGEDKIIFSACMHSSDAEWPQQRAAMAHRMQLFAATFDARMRPLVSAAQLGNSVFKLSA